jgi:hypothetical protein
MAPDSIASRAPSSAMLLRAGSAAAIVGTVVLVVATMLHPMSADPADPAAAFSEYAADRLWIASHLGQFLGIALIFVGLYALHRSLADGPVGWIADLALLFALAALVMAAVVQAVDGIALKAMVDHWAGASDAQKQAAFEAALAVRRIEIGAASLLALLFGTAGVLFGIAIATSAVYPAWLGWVAMMSGAGTAAGGVLTAFTGFSDVAMNVGMPFNLVMLAWIAAIGIVMWRQAARQG